jgi:hypothetical protein
VKTSHFSTPIRVMMTPVNPSTYYTALGQKGKEKIEETAWYRSEKRRIVAEELDIILPGDQDDDWLCAERLYREFGMSATPATYEHQIRTACAIMKALKDNPYQRLTAPFQLGKTGATLLVSELFIFLARKEKRFANVLHIPLNGQREIAAQQGLRIEQYRYTANVPDFTMDVKTYRCNGSAEQVKQLSKRVADPDLDLLIVPDESQFGTAVNSLFDRTVLNPLQKRKNRSVVLTVSATPYEQMYSGTCQDRFHDTRMHIAPGYRGPSMMDGVSYPALPGHNPEDVAIEEKVPAELKYYGGDYGKEKFDRKKVDELLSFIYDTEGFSHRAVRWFNIKSAEYAAGVLERRYGQKVVRHYGPANLKNRLANKWNKDDDATLFIVGTAKCSQTLPLDINNAIDLTSFNLEEQRKTITSFGQDLYGRMSGFNRPNPRLVTAPGAQQYVNAYKFGRNGNFRAKSHMRTQIPVTAAPVGKRPLTIQVALPIHHSGVHKTTLAAWEASGGRVIDDSTLAQLQFLCDQFLVKSGEYKFLAAGRAAVLTLVRSLYPSAQEIGAYYPKEGPSYNKTERRREPYKAQVIHEAGKVWAVSYSEPRALVVPPLLPRRSEETMRSSVYHKEHANERFPGPLALN